MARDFNALKSTLVYTLPNMEKNLQALANHIGKVQRQIEVEINQLTSEEGKK